ncbi:MAG: 4-demethylwyosine synthase TYW1 [Candidatus Thermoplasmatota archaeon]|nr:4-demethylwyosine synthase TYW1 [Candidatus Thermoplasmatota archaeon]MBU1941125.1 4-demethylwyosine synthase TYW1 [Candidatus Thermoplasmatota archaeon]
MKDSVEKILEKQQYAVIGNHSGVKLCHWMRQSLLYQRECYKQSFYGIQSHRCLQMTPTVNHCNHMCLFCWRHQNFTESSIIIPDDPRFILDSTIEAQQRLISGFKGDSRCDQKKWEEAHHPNMLACSLSGEPTLYPRLGDFFEECHKRNITTFLVTNGTTPKVLASLDPLPKQLYVSIVAPNQEIYRRLCAPILSNGWDAILETLELLPSLNTRVVLRHTLVGGWNMQDAMISEYARLDRIADPLFIEPKGYVYVGYSRRRMHLENMPTHAQVQHFGRLLASELGYEVLMEKEDSRVVLLGANKGNRKIV